MKHIPVLLHEVIDGLDFQDGDIFLDGTLGGGGHSEAAAKTGKKIKIVGLDMDQDALDRTKARLAPLGADTALIQSSFRYLDQVLDSQNISYVNKILLDLGLSSYQFEESGRGFTFQKNEPLLMSFKKNPTKEDLTAREIVNTWDEENLIAIFEGYGEEQHAKRIARKICEERAIKPLSTTFDLVEIVKKATPAWYHFKRIHPATKVFQALRITVNDEIESLKEGLWKGFERLAANGRFAVISFHSIEDRIVKNYFRDQVNKNLARHINKKPIAPQDEEIKENPRSRSAKLRIIEKI